MNAVIYARFSSHGQNEQSIESQIRVCQDYAADNGLNVVGTYIDKARSAFKEDTKRPEFDKMINDAAMGGFQNIIVYKFDRFARNRFDSMMHKQQLKKRYGIRVLSTIEQINDDEGGEIYEMITEWNDERYSKNLSRAAKLGLTTAVDNGTVLGGYLLYGYKKIDSGLIGRKKQMLHKFIIDEAEAKNVQFVFKEYSAGAEKDQIATELNKQGQRLKGKEFKGRDFDRWLICKKYTGVFTFGGRVCENTYPKIIEKSLFEKVQVRLNDNKHNAGKKTAREPYLLTGKLFCGHCGAAMVADGGTGRFGKTYQYYACKAAKKNKCNKKNEKKYFLEMFVVEQVVEHLKDEYKANLIADGVLGYHERVTDDSVLKSIENKIVDAKKQMSAAADAFIYADIEIKKILNDRVNELSILVKDLEREYSKVKFEQGLKITKKDILAFIKRLTEGDLFDEQYRKRIIDNLVNLVYSYDDKIAMYFNIKGGEQVSFVGLGDTNDAIESVLTCSNANTLSPPKLS